MKIKRSFIYITVFLFLVTAMALGAVSFVQQHEINIHEDTPAEFLGKYTFERSMVFGSGKVAHFYESGDEYFRYCHDENGYVLIRDVENETLTYGMLVSGRLISSGISFFASPQEVNGVDKVIATEIDFTLNPTLVTQIDRAAPYNGEVFLSSLDEEVVYVPQKPLFAGETEKRTITNLVILIKFNDTQQGVVDNAITAFDPYFNNPINSLKNYYETISYDEVTINSILPRVSPSEVYVYNGGLRSYYNIEDSNTARRRERESQLLGGAVTGAAGYFDLNGRNLDINDDGYVDSISFLICGSNEDTWGGLLWPHSWNLDSIEAGDGASKIGGIKIGDYSFNFSTSINVGVLCHEMGHVLGAPDLYHYNYDFVPVGKWDLMSSNTNMPQYMLAYTRDKYVGGIKSAQMVDILSSGIYNLSPVSTSYSTSDVIAYKIRLAEKPNEYFMIEYRNPIISSRYDSSLPGTGLILYRVREGGANTGNRDARYKSSIYPDEVFVYRPLVYMKPDGPIAAIYSDSLKDIDRANLSPQNPSFRSIGRASDITKYNFNNVFYSDGTNSRIVVEALSINSENAQFRISLPTSSSVIPENAFDNKVSISTASFYNATDWAGVRSEITFTSDINLAYLANVKVELLEADGTTVIATNNLNLADFSSKYNGGQRVFECPFVIRDKGNSLVSSFYIGNFLSENQPSKIKVTIINAEGKLKFLTPYPVSGGGAYTWQDILDSGQENLAGVFAGRQISLGINNDGMVNASGSVETGIWAIRGTQDASMVAVGRKHILVLTKDMTVDSFGENFYGETAVESWINIKQVAAGDYTSYGLSADGTVVATGINDFYQLQVGGWKNIVQIAAGARHVVGIDSDGKVFVAGDNSNGQDLVAGITSAKSVAAGDSFTFVLRENGEVDIIGTFPYSWNAADFSGSKKIAAGSRHVIAILENGTVIAAGDNAGGQCNTSGLYDIISMDGGENHSIYLREDGVVEYKGIGNPQYATNTPMENLIYSELSYIEASSISMSPSLRIAKDTNEILASSVLPVDATYQRVVFISSNPSIVSVDMFTTGTGYKAARIYGVGKGSATITARINGTSLFSSISVTVYEEKPLAGIVLVDESLKIVTNKTVKLNYSYDPLEATNVGSTSPSFVSSNPNVATVDVGNGVVTGVTSGVATITISITVNGVSYTDTCTVTVVEEEYSITVTQDPNPVKIKHNGTIDLNRLELKVTIGQDSPVVVPITSNMLSSYASSVIGSKVVTLTYMGQQAAINVRVEKYVNKVEFSKIPKAEYKFGDQLSIEAGEVGEIKATFSDGSSSLTAVSTQSTIGYASNVLGDQILTVRFSDPYFLDIHLLNYTVTVSDIVTSVAYEPRQYLYTFGSSFNNTEQLTLNMASNMVRMEDFDSPNIYYSGFDGNIRGQHLVRVQYTDRVNDNNVLSAEPVVIDVRMAGVFFYEGKDETSFIHYFETGKNLNLLVYFDQGQGARMEISTKTLTPNFWYETQGFDKALLYVNGNDNTQQTVTYKCYTKYSSVMGMEVTITDNHEFEDFYVTARGLAPITNWEIVRLSGGTYVAVGAEEVVEFEYSSEPTDPSPLDLMIRKTLSAGGTQITEPMEAVFDKELVGAVQTYGARYLDTFKEIKIKITDIPEYIIEIPKQIVKFGDALDFTVYVQMKKRGRTPVVPLSYSLEFRNPDDSLNSPSDYSQRLGIQNVKVTYTNENKTLHKVFQMEIIDVFSYIEMLEPPKAIYKYGESFAPETAMFRLSMRSSATIDEHYNAEQYSFTPALNSTNIGATQVITVRYNPLGTVIRSWTVNCKVENYVKKLIITPTKVEYRYGDPLQVEVRAEYADGANTKVNAGSYFHSYKPNVIGEQIVIFGYLEASESLTVHVSDYIKTIFINSSPEKRVYAYGEPLDFWGMRVTLKYESGQSDKVLDADAVKSELKITYNPTLVTPQQPVRVEGYVGGASTSFIVEVRADDESVLSAINSSVINVHKTDKVIAVSLSNQNLQNLAGIFNFAEYLESTIVDKNGSVLNPLSSRILKTGDRVIFKNGAGYKVYDFEINVFGDSNGDGQVSQSDLESMANRILAGENKKYVMDYNGDGKSTLTDIVLFAGEINSP